MNFKNRRPLLKGLLSIAATGFLLSACYPPMSALQKNTADRLAAPVFMHERHINTEDFTLTAFERVRKEGGVANIYIEGNGGIITPLSKDDLNLKLNRSFTPQNPVALHLSTFDNTSNVIYLARPCQYVPSHSIHSVKQCKGQENAPRIYSQTAIKSMNDALSEIKSRYGFTGFNLIGVGGGGAVAVILTAQRDDILSLRTVSGHLNLTPLHKGEDKSDMAGALNPLDYAPLISQVPQHHFIGDHDKMLTPEVYMSYLDASAPRKCLRFSIVEDASHDKGMVNAWTNMMDLPVDCMRTETPGTVIINKVEKL
jgi:hypothetical protein